MDTGAVLPHLPSPGLHAAYPGRSQAPHTLLLLLEWRLTQPKPPLGVPPGGTSTQDWVWQCSCGGNGCGKTLVLTSVLQMGKGEERESSFRGVIPLALDPVDCLDGESSLTILGSLDEKGGDAGAAFPLGFFPVDAAYVSLIVKGPDSPLGGRRPLLPTHVGEPSSHNSSQARPLISTRSGG